MVKFLLQVKYKYGYLTGKTERNWKIEMSEIETPGQELQDKNKDLIFQRDQGKCLMLM